MKTVWPWVGCFGLLLALPVSAWCQVEVSPLDGYTPGQTMQGSPLGSVALSGFESYNLGNGVLNVNVPLLTVHGRGPV